jgi:hypothetical protein
VLGNRINSEINALAETADSIKSTFNSIYGRDGHVLASVQAKSFWTGEYHADLTGFHWNFQTHRVFSTVAYKDNFCFDNRWPTALDAYCHLQVVLTA